MKHITRYFDQDSLKRIFFEAESHAPVMDHLRTSSDPHTHGGNVALIDPSGDLNMICTLWYARAWCADHKDWKWEPV